MDGVTIRAALPGDAPLLAGFRVALALEGGMRLDQGRGNAYTERCSAFFAESLASGAVLAWLAFAGDEAVGAASLELRWTFPRSHMRKPLDARIRSVFVKPANRRRGIASMLTKACIGAAKRLSVDRLTLGASDLGVALYASLGFVMREREMIYTAAGEQP